MEVGQEDQYENKISNNNIRINFNEEYNEDIKGEKNKIDEDE